LICSCCYRSVGHPPYSRTHTLCPLSPGADPSTTRPVPSALSLLSASVALDSLRRLLRPYRLYCTAVQVGAVLLCTAAGCIAQQNGGARLQRGRAASCSAGLWGRSPPAAAAGRAPRIRARRSRCTSQPAKETLRNTRSQRACYGTYTNMWRGREQPVTQTPLGKGQCMKWQCVYMCSAVVWVRVRC